MIVLDTHVFVWAMEGSPRLGPEARRTIDEASHDNETGISAITPWEIALLEDRGRLRLAREVSGWLEAALGQPGIRLLPIIPKVAVDSVKLPGAFHADPADRLIVATARHWNACLITADAAIVTYGEAGHVEVLDATR